MLIALSMKLLNGGTAEYSRGLGIARRPASRGDIDFLLDVSAQKLGIDGSARSTIGACRGCAWRSAYRQPGSMAMKSPRAPAMKPAPRPGAPGNHAVASKSMAPAAHQALPQGTVSPRGECARGKKFFVDAFVKACRYGFAQKYRARNRRYSPGRFGDNGRWFVA